MNIQLKSVVFALPIAALAACTAPSEEADAPEVAETMASEAGEPDSSEGGFEVCDENGNRYPSEDAAKDAGLEAAQYGATYCQYFE